MKKFASGEGIAQVTADRGILRGFEYDGLSIFKGIPYAKARRFHRPEPVDPWEGVLECTSYGYVCPIAVPGKPGGELGVPHRYWVQNENCQNLNIWTPGLDNGKRPVLVWLHGGGFSDGSSIEQIAYDGANLAKQGDVVVVSLNHRLNILGYFDLSDFGEEYANSGNAGGDDIIAALKWIHTNIARFGGDPANVTVFGQSGGGAKVTTLLQSPDADGLYAKGINMSGVIGPILADAVGSGKECAEAVMKELGISSVKELEEVPYGPLRAAYDKVSPALKAAGKNVGFAPHPNAFYLGEPTTNGFRAETADVPLLVGSVYGEFLGFFRLPGFGPDTSDEEALHAMNTLFGEKEVQTLLPLFCKAYPDHPLRDLIRLDTLFRGPEIAYIAARSRLNACTWTYLFDHSFYLNGGTVAWHCADIPYVFGNAVLDSVEYTHEDGMELLQKQIMNSVLAFARSGNPNHGAIPVWEADAPGRESVMKFGNETKAMPANYDHELIAKLAEVTGPAIRKLFAQMSGDIQH